jgi:hypothetical protein
MSLIINQGKQDTTQDKSFEVMTSAEEMAQITKIEMDTNWENTLNITYKIISDGKYKGRLFWDRISFDPKGQFSWKYRNLRKAAGCPYSETESPKIDIEALLLNKAVKVELLVRKGNDGNDYQSCKYKPSDIKKTQTTIVETPTSTIDENDLPIDTTDTDVEW